MSWEAYVRLVVPDAEPNESQPLWSVDGCGWWVAGAGSPSETGFGGGPLTVMRKGV